MQYKYVALTVTTVGASMAALDSSCMTIGLPTVLKDLNATIFQRIWIITGYRLMLTVLLVILGRIADMHGRVRLYNMGRARVFIGAINFSAWCSVSCGARHHTSLLRGHGRQRAKKEDSDATQSSAALGKSP